MAKNDLILIDSIIDERVKMELPSNDRSEVFEWFTFEQLFKDDDLSKDEIESCWVDGRNDGGIDGFFIFVNDYLYSQQHYSSLPKKNSEIRVVLVSCKHASTYKQATVESLLASTTELFDFSLEQNELKGDYNTDVLSKRKTLIQIYKRLSIGLNRITFDYYYASRGDSTLVGDSIVSRSNQIVEIINQNFSSSSANFSFLGSAELLEMYRKKQEFKLILKFEEQLSSGDQKYIVLTNLSDYYNFMTDESLKLRKYLFDSNVRDYMGFNKVNKDIISTLQDKNSPDFWLLNNGVTILATSAANVGKELVIENVQVVNGLQTTESIYKHFSSFNQEKDTRKILIKVIVSAREEDRDKIIKATNSQTVVETQALHATDKIQKDIESILKRNDFYYNRRTNYYQNIGVEDSNIITPLYIARAYRALIEKNVNKARNLKQKFMNNPVEYSKIFSEKDSLDIWPILARIMSSTDHFLVKTRRTNDLSTIGYLNSYRYVVSFLTVSKIIGNLNYSKKDLLEIDLNEYNYDTMSEILEIVRLVMDNTKKRKRITNTEFKKIRKNFANKYGIKDLNNVFKYESANDYSELRAKCSPEIIKDVYDKLPNTKGWKPGIHEDIAMEMNQSPEMISCAINLLFKSGIIDRKTRVRIDFDASLLSLHENELED